MLKNVQSLFYYYELMVQLLWDLMNDGVMKNFR